MRRTLPAELMDVTPALQAIIITAQVGSNNQLIILVVSNIYMYCDLHCSFMRRFNNSGVEIMSMMSLAHSICKPYVAGSYLLHNILLVYC